jgi:hypothetical protein
VLDRFKIFKNELENLHELKIKIVRSDRGGGGGREGEYYDQHNPYGQVPGPL